MKINIYTYGVLSLSLAMVLVACSSEEIEKSIDPLNGPPTIEVVDEGSRNMNNDTRALYSNLTQFSLYVVDEWYEYDGAIADNILQSNVSGVWKSAETYYFLDDPQNAYGISPTADLDGMSGVNITYDSQKFTYTVPSDIDEQSMIKIASRLNFTKKSINNNLKMTFRNTLFSLEVQAVNEIKDVSIYIKSIKFHNVIPTGTFTFNKKKESRGSWEVDVDDRSTCKDYEQVLDNAVELSRTNYLPIVNTTFTLMPQDLYENLWYPLDCEWADPSMVETFADAKTKKHMYIEVKCQIVGQVNNQTVYYWGYPHDLSDAEHPEYESVYFPYNEDNCLSAWDMGINSVYYLEFNTLTGGYDSTGQHITPHDTSVSGAMSAFENAEPVPFKVGNDDAGNVDSWDTSDTDEEVLMDGQN